MPNAVANKSRQDYAKELRESKKDKFEARRLYAVAQAESSSRLQICQIKQFADLSLTLSKLQ